MAKKESLLDALEKPYSLPFFSQQVLQPVFGSNVKIFTTSIPMVVNPSEQNAVKWIKKYGEISVTDYKQVDLYEVALNDNVVVERNKVSIGAVVKKLIAGNNAVLANFYYPNQTNKNWRFSFIARDKKIEEGKVVEAGTNPKRYTYVLGPNERCRTAAERFFKLSVNPEFDIEKLQEAFSVEKLSKTFFDEYKEHYETFVKHLSKREIKASVFNGDDKSVRDFAKKLLGRIVFLYFVQKKGWLGASNDKWQDGNPNFMQDLFVSSGKKETFYPLWLRTLFYDSLNNPDSKDNVFTLPDGKKVKVPYLNGGLFEDDDPKGSSKYLVFPPTLFTDLFEFFNQYNFTIYEDSPDDHTIAVDPEMLGHIFENLLEDNKDKGAYYTPKEIVHYMCQESLIQYLATKLDIPENKTFQELGTDQQGMFGNEVKKGQLDILKENKTITPGITRADVERFIKQKETTPQIIKHAVDINKHLDNVKICDPAIGSGAFPMGLLHEIFNTKQVLKEVANIPELQKTGNAKIKEDIIQNSIYGVDIEKGAVDIARLRFWLSLIVDEELPRPLPNLDYKIVVGDSLLPKFDGEVVDIEWDAVSSKTDRSTSSNKVLIDKQKNDLLLLVVSQKKYFSAKNDKEKAKLKQQIRDLKIDILLNQLQLDKVKYSTQNTVNEDMFGGGKKEKELGVAIQLKISGFNQSIKKLENLQKYLNKQLQFFDWKLDFPEILNGSIISGVTGFDIVIGNPPYGANLTDIEKIIIRKKYLSMEGEFDSYMYFIENALTIGKINGVCCFIIPNNLLQQKYGRKLRKILLDKTTIKTIIDLGLGIFENAVIPTAILIFNLFPSVKDSKVNCFFRPSIKELNDKFFRVNQNDFLENDGFAMNIQVNENDKNIIKSLDHNSEKLKNVCELKIGIEGAPEYISDLPNNKFSKPLVRGRNFNRYSIDFESDPKYIIYKRSLLHRPREERLFDCPKKILIRQTSDKIIATIDKNRLYAWKSVFVILSDESKYTLEYLLALLNSKTLNYYYQKIVGESGRVFAQVKGVNLDKLPIKAISIKEQKPFVTLVEKILMLKKGKPETNTFHLERQIDVMVYQLYNLKYAEAKVIDDTLTEDEWEKWKV